MPILIIVNDPKDLALRFEGGELVTARTYLTDSRYALMRGAKVFNLCTSYRYQGTGYYVSLLAAARGHKPVPNITTIQDLKSQTLIRLASEELEEIIRKSLSGVHSSEFVLSIYFGKNLAKRYDYLSLRLFKLFQAPFLRVLFTFNEKTSKWHIDGITPIAANEIPEEHREFAVKASQEFFGRRPRVFRKTSFRYDLAILYNPSEKEPPSDERALHKFVRAAESLGLATELIEKDDFGRIPEFDALFIRETTSVTHHTYRFARRAMAEGLVVVDDPESILKCTNKVFLAEILERHKILIPRTVIVHRDNSGAVCGTLGLPVVLKRPDSSFSQGVVKVESEKELTENVQKMLERSDLIIAQEFIATDYDWRVGIFDRQPLYVCKYYMARKHWQIIKRDSTGRKTDEGDYDSMSVEYAPPRLIRAALRAGNLIGDGFYGVDIKQVGEKFYVIEINDNPNVESGVEDKVLKDELYLRIMRVMLRRIEQIKRGSPA